jgi:acetyl-CoA carboxylase biotin carboxyl carrier protein
MQLDDEDVRAILQLLDASAFDELQIETDRFNLTLRRGDGAWTRESRTLGTPRELPGAAAAAAAAGAEHAASSAAPSTAASAAPVAEPVAPGGAGAGSARLEAVRTPLPGTFYRSPKPGAPPFVDVGARVERDTVVAIVETMKLMNAVYAGCAGRVAEICATDATLVEQQAVLMRIDPDLS